MQPTATDTTGPVAAPSWLSGALARIESDERLDLVGGRIAAVGRQIGATPAGPYLRGEAVGHSVHPALSVLRTGVFGASLVLDVVGGPSSRKAAKRLAAVGVVMSLPTAVTGLVEYADAAEDDEKVRRVGALYSLANALTTFLFVRSWQSRHRGHGVVGAGWNLLGAVPATIGLYLGGHLTRVLGFCSGPRGLDGADARTPDVESGDAGSAPGVRAV